MDTRDLAAVGACIGGGILAVVGVALLLPVGCAVLTAGVLLLGFGIAIGRRENAPPPPAPDGELFAPLPEELPPAEREAVGAALDTLKPGSGNGWVG